MSKPALVSTWGSQKRFVPFFLESAKRHGLEPHNSDPGDWPSSGDYWRKSVSQFNFLKAHSSEFTHFMFTDSSDIIFAAGWDEILTKFEKLNSPIVFGTEAYCWPDSANLPKYPNSPHRCRFLNAGMWIATTEAALLLAKDIVEIARHGERCDQGIASELFLSGRYPIVLDMACSLLFCMNMEAPGFLDMSGPRPKTTDTGEEPCIFHGNSGVDLHPLFQKLCR